MSRLISVRTELLINIAMLTATALLVGVASIVVLYDVLDPAYASVYMALLVGLDVAVLVASIAYQVDRIIIRPMREAVATAEAIAAGHVDRRLDPGESVEMANLATSVNRMTDILLAERAYLVRAEKMASVGRLASGVAHEIGNPLGAINGYAHVLRKMPASGTAAQDAIAGLEREAARIDRIVRGLLDYARPSARKPGLIDLNETTRTVVELLDTQGALRRVRVDFAPAANPVHVSGDRHDFEQLLVNLVLNAADAMSGAGTLAISVRECPRADVGAGRRNSDASARVPTPLPPQVGRWVDRVVTPDVALVTVADSGPGIPAEDLDRIFEPFYTTKDPGKGTGLGLAIVQRAVENAGGTIWVTPSREGGAAFRMAFPAAKRT